MKHRPVRTPTQALAAAGLALAISGPVWADCCDSFFDCAATVVTEGVSCEIQTILDTIKTIQTIVTNVRNDVTGQTQAAEATARQGVSDTYNTMQSQSQQSSSDLSGALTQATTLYKTETQIMATLPTAQMANRNLSAAGAPPGTAPSSALPTATLNNPNLNAASPPPAGPPHTMSSIRTQPVNTIPANSNPALQKSTVTGSTTVAANEVKVAAPHGAYADALSRGLKEITTLKQTGDQDFNTVNQYLAQALATEGPGVAAADTVGAAMLAPLTALQSLFSSMLSNPFSAFDPSSLADQVESTVEANLSANIGQMINDISTGPNQAFNSAQPTYDDLLTRAERAQAIASAMAQLYKIRTAGAANALYALLPITPLAGLNQASTAKVSLVGGFGQRMSFASVSSKLSTARQRAQLAYKPPGNSAQLHAAVVQFKTQRAQGRSALPQSAMLAVRGTFATQLDNQFKGKSPAAIASTRDQLIGQAQHQFAGDPKTGSAVIALLTSEAAKRGATTNASLTNPTIPPQPVATTTAQRAPVTAASKLGTPVVPASAAAVAPTAAKAPSWGPAPAWTPGRPSTAPTTTLPPTSTFKSTQAPQQPLGTSGTQPVAPSSLGR